MAKYVLVVFSAPIAGREAEYNDWYTNRHVPDVLEVPGFTGARRLAVAPGQPAAASPYLALYEVETDDPQKAMSELSARAGTPAMVLSDALDISVVSATLYATI